MSQRKPYRGIPIIQKYDIKKLRNLVDLADAIRKSPPPKFNMSAYASLSYDDRMFLIDENAPKHHVRMYDIPMSMNILGKAAKKEINVCGSSACAVGTGAFHNIGVIKSGDSWADYQNRNFVDPDYGPDTYKGRWDDVVSDLLFGGEWDDDSAHDNASHAANRILWFVMEGGPDLLREYNTPIEDWAEAMIDMQEQANLVAEGRTIEPLVRKKQYDSFS